MEKSSPNSIEGEVKLKCIRVPFARRKIDKRIVDAKEVPSGKKCGCQCVACNADLIARHPRKTKRIHHFAHKHDPEHPCKKAAETALHKAAKQIVAELPCLSLPQSQYFAARNFQIMEGHVEKPFPGFQPDIYLRDKNGSALAVEIRVTHEVEQEKRIKLCNVMMDTVEIDLRKVPRLILYSNLVELISGQTLPVAWVFHNGDAQHAKEIRLQAEAERLARQERMDKFYEEKRRREADERLGKWAKLMPWAIDPPIEL